MEDLFFAFALKEDELDDVFDLVKNVPDLKKYVLESSISLLSILQVIKEEHQLDSNTKEFLKRMLMHFHKLHISNNIYKYKCFKTQEIDTLDYTNFNDINNYALCFNKYTSRPEGSKYVVQNTKTPSCDNNIKNILIPLLPRYNNKTIKDLHNI